MTVKYEDGLIVKFKFYIVSGSYKFDFKIVLHDEMAINRSRITNNNNAFHLFSIMGMLDRSHSVEKVNPLGTLRISFPLTPEEDEALISIIARAKHYGLDINKLKLQE